MGDMRRLDSGDLFRSHGWFMTRARNVANFGLMRWNLRAGRGRGGTMLILGEVHSGLQQNRGPLSSDNAAQVLELVLGEAVLVSERPIPFVQSPTTLAGVDCGLAVTAGKPMRAIGTVTAQASLAGGHVVQASAHATVTGTDRTHRMPWSYYLARPGVLETAGREPGPEVAEAFLVAGPAPDTLDLGAIAARVADQVQATETLDRKSKIKVVRTRLRWAAEADDADRPARVEFGVDTDGFRTLRLRTGPIAAADLLAVCEDVALHDWLLTALIELVRKSALGANRRRRARIAAGSPASARTMSARSRCPR